MGSHGRNKAGSFFIAIGGGALLVGGMLITGYLVQVQDAAAGGPRTTRGPTGPAATAVTTAAPETQHVGAAVEAYLSGGVTLEINGASVVVKRSELGLVADPTSFTRATLKDGQFDGLVPVVADLDRALKYLTALKNEHRVGAQDAYLDLEGRKVRDAVPGWELDVFSSQNAIETAGRIGAETISMVGVNIPAGRTRKDLGIDDISTVLSTFTTRFSVNEKSRNTNLKLLASRIDGHVLQPGELFSFNGISGDRTLNEGYKMAHVILAGEMVDGEAGGACQISTTLHGAAFFSGLEIVETTPHSRPSTYVTMGLDATVVYPRVDLKLRNPFEFPVAIHFRVARGRSTVEILGKEKPFDKITFEREVTKRLQFETVTREDEGIPVGNLVIDQPGYPGYKVSRRRVYHKGDKVVKRDKWALAYRPVVEYVRVGTNPDPNLPPPRHKKPHGPKPASGTFRMTQ